MKLITKYVKGMLYIVDHTFCFETRTHSPTSCERGRCLIEAEKIHGVPSKQQTTPKPQKHASKKKNTRISEDKPPQQKKKRKKTSKAIRAKALHQREGSGLHRERHFDQEGGRTQYKQRVVKQN